MIIFNIGYFLGFVLILGNKRIYNKFAFGPPSKFQNNMTLLSIILMFILLVGMGGQFFATQNYRMIWLSAFLAIGIHFFPFCYRTRKDNVSSCYFSFNQCYLRHGIFFYSFFCIRLYRCYNKDIIRYHHVFFKESLKQINNNKCKNIANYSIFNISLLVNNVF